MIVFQFYTLFIIVYTISKELYIIFILLLFLNMYTINKTDYIENVTCV